MIKFESFGKIPRLFRDVVVTEKIDGTNGAIGIVDLTGQALDGSTTALALIGSTTVGVYAQSRNRVITPDKDNYGFARWVWDNAAILAAELGPGLHFGEWWGSGIQRGYGLSNGDKRFSLFNVKRWEGTKFTVTGLGVVPVVERGEMSTVLIRGALSSLQWSGSLAAPGFMRPEGVVVYHTAGNTLFKATIENDSQPKTQSATLTDINASTTAVSFMNAYYNSEQAA